MNRRAALSGFPEIQAAYAARRVATYPLAENKKPAVKAYGRVGAPYSRALAEKFPDATAAGFCAGERNRLTVIDIDSKDEKLVDEIQAMYGVSPLQIVTPSGGRHLYYRHGGEGRRISALPNVDVLGGGHVVAAGSRTSKGRYDIERGSLDDIDHLPRMARSAAAEPVQRIPEGKRNEALHRYLRSIVSHCDDLDTLIDAGRTWVDDRVAGNLPDAEVAKTAASVWRFRGGRRLFMQHIVEGPQFAILVQNVEAWALCAYLMAENGPDAEFWIADGLGDARGWSQRFVPRARRALLEMGIIQCVRPRGNGVPALYRWAAPQIEAEQTSRNRQVSPSKQTSRIR